MIKEFWINLPVKDLEKSKSFYTKIGFTLNPRYGNHGEHSASLLVGQKGIVVMLFDEITFKSFTGNNVADAANTMEVLFSIDVESREEVDGFAKKIEAAGGKINNSTKEVQGWMYGFVFADPDGHKWNVLHMDMDRLPAGTDII